LFQYFFCFWATLVVVCLGRPQRDTCPFSIPLVLAAGVHSLACQYPKRKLTDDERRSLVDDILGLGGEPEPPVAADHRIYIASAEGVVTVIDAGAKLNVLATKQARRRLSSPHPH